MRSALAATAAYFLIAVVLTWPLAAGIARDVPADLGDPLLVMWILAWDAEQLRAILGGDVSRIASFFDANIFHPAPLTLAYSEHLFAQAVQIFPVYLATRNPILCYNLLFLSTFVLSGLGMFLLVRALTGRTRAGFVGGLLFACALYRWTHLSHLQVLSAQWMPFALYGFHRYFETGRIRPLAGAAAALIAQNLSCGYYLLYFAIAVVIFVLWEIATHETWRSRRTWMHLAAAALAVALVTAPFLIPYKRVRDALQTSRGATEVIRYSADVYSYLTAPDTSPVWSGSMRAFPKPEGDLFPGAVPLVLALVACIAAIAAAARVAAPERARVPAWVLVAVGGVGVLYAMVAAAAIFARRLDWPIGFATIRVTDVTRLLLPPVVSIGVIAWLSPTTRLRLAAFARRPEAVCLALLVAAWWLSLGPAPRVLGRPLDLWAPYGVLYEYVPGFDGVRVPARFAMIATLALSMLGGLGIAHLERFRIGAAAAILASALFLLEAQLPPMAVNGVAAVRGYATPEPRVYRPARAPGVYHAVARTPPDAVVLELPIGQPDYDTRSVYYSTAHWRRLVNGYSGFFPAHYARVTAMLDAAFRGDEAAWTTLQELGVTHIVIHEAAYLDDEGVRFGEWLRRHGGVEIYRDDRDSLLALPR